MKPKDESYANGQSQNGYRREYATMEPYATSIIKVVTLRRRGNSPLGFSIRGGWEHGTGVFISEIIPGSIAQKQGLRIGDQIVRINGFSIHRAIHMEVLSLLKTCPGIVLKIKRVGILPVKERDKDPVTWKIVEPQNSLICSDHVAHSRVNGTTLENSIIVKVEITVPGSGSLGCSIAKGPPELPGIFMCTVKSGGIADMTGLQVGDQILDMNGTSFHELKLNEAVALMKSAKDIRLTVKKGAGISLFLDNNSNSQLCNKNEDTISTTRSISDGLPPPLKEEERDFGSCSSKSEGSSSFQSSVSSDSEKDYSISEESSEGGVGKKAPSSNWHKKQPSTSSSGASSSSPAEDEASWSSRRKDDAWIEEEKRALEENRRQLEEEKRRLDEERKKLELERSASRMSSVIAPPPPPTEETNSFLNELQKVAARMNSSEGRDENRNGTTDKMDRSEPVFKGKRGKDDAIKRMQHEMLMEEFREAHRKMFGQHSLVTVDKNIKNGDSLQHQQKKEAEELKQPMSLDNSRIVINTKPKQPVPLPPKPDETKKECQKITVNGQVLQSHPLRVRQAIPSVQVAAPPVEKESPTVTHAVPNGFRVTVTPGRTIDSNAPKSKSGALVEVTPWTTRL